MLTEPHFCDESYHPLIVALPNRLCGVRLVIVKHFKASNPLHTFICVIALA